MLNEDKIKLMTSMAMFEKKNGKAMNAGKNYFKSDYVSRQMIRGFFNYTISCTAVLFIWILYSMEQFLSTLSFEGMLGLIRNFVIYYLIGLAVYMGLVHTVYSRRYDYAAKNIRLYTAKLKHLDKRYDYHNRSRTLAKEDRRV